jgi:hypothetical protein
LKDPQSGFVDNRFIAPLESFHQYQCNAFLPEARTERLRSGAAAARPVGA